MHAQLMLNSHEEYRNYILASRRSKKLMQKVVDSAATLLQPFESKKITVTLDNRISFDSVFTGVKLASQADLKNKPTKVLFKDKLVTPPIAQLVFEDGKFDISLISIREINSRVSSAGYSVLITTTKVPLLLCQS